jgi:hypothetical protein
MGKFVTRGVQESESLRIGRPRPRTLRSILSFVRDPVSCDNDVFMEIALGAFFLEIGPLGETPWTCGLAA